jgi:hypothetical protein
MRPFLCTLHTGYDGPYDRDHDLWPKPFKQCSQTSFALKTSFSALAHGHPVYRLSAQVDQVAAQIAK